MTNPNDDQGTGQGAAQRVDFFVPEHQEGEPEVLFSPSGRFRLTVRSYRTSPGGWNYTRGTVTRAADGPDGAVVCDIKRNFAVFHHSFATKDGREYLITGRSYMEPTIVDLERGVELTSPHREGEPRFCWASCELSPDGKTLAVDGCVWANPYEIRFFDFTDPARGWPPLAISGLERLECPSDETPSHWLDETTFECLMYYSADTKAPQERARLARRGDEMVVVDYWICEEHRARMEALERAANGDP